MGDNYYSIYYSNPTVIDRYDVIKSLEYNLVGVENNFKKHDKINTLEKNNIFLDPQKKNTFNKYTINKIKEIDIVDCKLREVKVKGWKLLKYMRDNLKDMKKNKKKIERKLNENKKKDTKKTKN